MLSTEITRSGSGGEVNRWEISSTPGKVFNLIPAVVVEILPRVSNHPPHLIDWQNEGLSGRIIFYPGPIVP
ncbi:hypothetical protein OAG51_02520 [Pirellulaceae bacterium]|jgi:hypothetical protein|nr:hypothetical protein [Pirellulaceae bacterium]